MECQVSILYLPPLSDLVGTGREIINLPPGATMDILIAKLAERHGSKLMGLFYDPSGAWRPKIGIFVNARAAMSPGHKLPPSGEVALVPPLAGG